MTDKNDALKLINEPVFVGFDEQANKVRVQLFFWSIVSLILMWFHLEIDKHSSFLGLKFVGLTNEIILYVLLILLIYLLFHFLWLSMDAFIEWKHRKSGYRELFVNVKTFEDLNIDSPKARQSSLAFYWNYKVLDSITRYEKEVSKCLSKPIENLNSRDIENVKDSIDELKELLSGELLSEPLKQFDKSFKFFSLSQNSRWFWLEFSLPVMLSVISIGSLICKLSC